LRKSGLIRRGIGKDDMFYVYSPGKFHLVFQTSVILAGMAVLFGLIGWLLMGVMGIVYALFIALILFFPTPKISPRMVLRLYRAKQLSYQDVPELYTITHELARRADLKTVPQLYHIPTSGMNAFSVGASMNSAIAVSDGIIRSLSLREITGVIAHEISHIRNNDLKLLSLADLMTRITSILSFIGQILIVLYLPLVYFSKVSLPLIPILLLISAPSFSILLQLALSRAREFSADLDSASLTGDPRGLASALEKMDQYDKNIWEYVFPLKKQSYPSLMRTHPNTKERLERLRSLPQDEKKIIITFDMDGQKKYPLAPPVGEEVRWNWFR
jgi:heat shock protein HtpX